MSERDESRHKSAPEDAGPGGASPVIVARLFAGLDRLSRQGGVEQRVPAVKATSVTALCEALGLAVGVVGLVLVNGTHGDLATALHDGDEVSLFPPVGGG